MTRPAIIINELDAERIDRLLEQPLSPTHRLPMP